MEIAARRNFLFYARCGVIDIFDKPTYLENGPVMEYVKWVWRHTFHDEPCLFFAELDDDRWPVKTVEIYKDRHQAYAQEGEKCGTFLPDAAYPPNAEINATTEFRIKTISKQEFTQVWINRREVYHGSFFL